MNAEQKNYIYTNVNLIITASTIVVQIISLVIWKNFLVYLLVAAGFGVFQKIFVSIYFDKLYPYLRDKNVKKLSKDEKNTLVSKVKALVIHKIGDVSVHQTDNIIVSAFVSTKMVGLLSNYNLIFQHKLQAMSGHFMHFASNYATHKAGGLLYKQLLVQSKLMAYVDVFEIFALSAFVLIPFGFLLKVPKREQIKK